jgi:hypothetical protein
MSKFNIVLIAIISVAIAFFLGKGCTQIEKMPVPKSGTGKVISRDTVITYRVDTVRVSVPKLVPQLIYSKPIIRVGKSIHDTILVAADTANFVKDFLTESVFHTRYSDSLLQLDTYDTLRFGKLVSRKLDYQLFNKAKTVTITEKVKVPPSGSLSAGLLLHLMPKGEAGMYPYLLYQSKHKASFLAGYDLNNNAPVLGLSFQIR